MSVIGAFPLQSDIKRRTIRAPTNPLDKSTVFSIYPIRIREVKPTIQPGVFEIPAGSYEEPARLLVESSSWWKELDENQPLLEIPQSSIQVADSIVRDYCTGIFGCDMGENVPGLFYIPGDISIAQLMKDHQAELEEANRKQRNWYLYLVKAADGLWARTGGNSLAIMDQMRIAAQALNLVNKEWYADQIATELVRCKACGHLKNPNFPVCSNCKAIDNPEKAKALGLVFAQ